MTVEKGTNKKRRQKNKKTKKKTAFHFRYLFMSTIVDVCNYNNNSHLLLDFFFLLLLHITYRSTRNHRLSRDSDHSH